MFPALDTNVLGCICHSSEDAGLVGGHLEGHAPVLEGVALPGEEQPQPVPEEVEPGHGGPLLEPGEGQRAR